MWFANHYYPDQYVRQKQRIEQTLTECDFFNSWKYNYIIIIINLKEININK